MTLEFEDVFSPLIFIEGKPSENFKNAIKKVEDQKIFFLHNLHKDKIPSMIFKKLGYGNLLDIEDNVIALNKILKNPNFIKLFKISDMTLDGVCKIIYIYDNSSKYHVNSLKLRQKKDKEILEGLEKNYSYFNEKSKNFLDFNEWLNQRLDFHINMAIQNLINSKLVAKNIDLDLIKNEMKNSFSIFSNSDVLFNDYIKVAQYLVNARDPFAPKEKNIQINFFVREIKNTFHQKISNQIICELTSTLFGHELDETGVKNILKNANTNPINTQMMTQITVGEENNTIEHFKLADKF